MADRVRAGLDRAFFGTAYEALLAGRGTEGELCGRGDAVEVCQAVYCMLCIPARCPLLDPAGDAAPWDLFVVH